MANKIDSNVSGLSFAEEVDLKTLPEPASNTEWFELEPNSYSDFGGDFENLVRAPINASRQRKKGKIVDLDASGGFNTDITSTNSQRILQGFFFADAREKPGTQNFNTTSAAISLVDGVNSEFETAGAFVGFLPGHLVKTSGFANSTNNGVFKVLAASGTVIEVDGTLVDDATPLSTAKIEVVGCEFGSGELEISNLAGGTFDLEISIASSLDWTDFGLTIGEWIFVGGDLAANQIDNNAPGYARIKRITDQTISIDESTFDPTVDAGAGKTVRVFFGTVIRNEKQDNLIKRRSYNIERKLGQDSNGVQTEYLEGAVANEFTLNIPESDKLNADLSFVAMDNNQRTGLQGPKAGSRIPAPTEDAYNTSSDIYRIKMNVLDSENLNNEALFGYVTEASIAINNGVTPNKAVGVLGSFDTTAGDFEVSGSVTAYFTTIAAVQSVRNNADVSLSFIAAQNNQGFIYDIPLMGLSGGRLNVEKDNPITIPIENNAAENEEGYTMLSNFFAYLPTIAMPA